MNISLLSGLALVLVSAEMRGTLIQMTCKLRSDESQSIRKRTFSSRNTFIVGFQQLYEDILLNNVIFQIQYPVSLASDKITAVTDNHVYLIVYEHLDRWNVS